MNRGHVFENNVKDFLNQNELLSSSTFKYSNKYGNDVAILNHKTKKLIFGEIKLSHRSAFGQITISWDKLTGWAFSQKAFDRSPRFAQYIEKKTNLIELLNEINPDGTVSKFKEITIEVDNLEPAKLYYFDRKVSFIHIGSHGTFSIDNKKISKLFDPLDGIGKFRVRQKHPGNKMTIQFSPKNKRCLNTSSFNILNQNDINSLKNYLEF
jgi:hypothetical protein